MRPAGLVALAVAILWCGCATDQARDVRTYRDIVDIDPSIPPFERGDPISLDLAIRLANAQNERLSIEGESYVQALAARQRAASALFPTVDLVGSWLVRENVGLDPDGGAEPGSQFDNSLFEAGFGFQYTFMTGMTDYSLVRAGNYTIEQRRWLLLDLRETLLLETAQAYYSVLRAERLVAVLESSMAVQEERLRDIRARAEVGFARPLDVAQIEAQASQTAVLLLDARNEVVRSRATLGFLTGVDAGRSVLVDSYQIPSSVPTLADVQSLAFDARQDLVAAEAAALAASAEVDAEIGKYFPTITVNLDYFLTREVAPSDRDWSGILTASVPVFTAGRIAADVRAAWSRFREAVLNHSLTRRTIIRDVEIAYANLTASERRIVELKRQVDTATEALRQSEAAYAAGLGTNLERVTAQDAQLNAQLRMASEEFGLKVAYLASLRAAGVLTATVTKAVVPRVSPDQREAPSSPFIIAPGHDPARETSQTDGGTRADAR